MRERAALPAAERVHLQSCPSCQGRVAGTARIAAALREREEAAEPVVPSFDALVAPHLDAAPEPVPVPGVRLGQAFRLTIAVILRQAVLVPRLLWLVAVGGFAALAVAVLLVPASGAVAYLGPVTVALVTLGAVAVCDPKRDPRYESLYAMLVPPVVVWLSRLTFVLGAILLMAAAVSTLAAALPGSGQETGSVIGVWLSPALLGAGLTTFGAVWRAPAVGMAFGAVSWTMSVVAGRDDLFGPTAGAAAAAVWTHNGVSLPLAVLTLAGATWLASRPATNPSGG